ncbi:hypothetical protein [Silvimonas iriomotensis]|uniref:Uncharacterized protein n=1 Tax=Silvimonas iriomotensis TaxID=449662 RepID=A0ABQ2P8B4_9NEIS|nr:hypothetical protein [Silvimonas iriomotensis]GGP20582.1 hypothetical protein GCM10010970_15930 [Silvimonas iriomotensis]
MIDPLRPTAPDDETQLSEGEAQAAINHIASVAGIQLTFAQLTDLLADWTHVRENIIDWGMDDPAAVEDLNNTLSSELLDEPWQEGDADFLAQLQAAAAKRGYVVG